MCLYTRLIIIPKIKDKIKLIIISVGKYTDEGLIEFNASSIGLNILIQRNIKGRLIILIEKLIFHNHLIQ